MATQQGIQQALAKTGSADYGAQFFAVFSWLASRCAIPKTASEHLGGGSGASGASQSPNVAETGAVAPSPGRVAGKRERPRHDFEAALFRDPGDPLRFSYSAWPPLASEVEEQMTQLLREYKRDGEFLSPHAPEIPGVHDDAPTAIALAVLAASGGGIGDILF
jgi:hypothetical protein